MNNSKIFAKRLKKLRLNKQVNQQSLADHVGVNQPAIARMENGKMEPTGEVLSKLADYFNVTTDYLLGRKEIKESTDLPDVLKRAGIDAIRYTGEFNLTEKEIKRLLKYAKFLKIVEILEGEDYETGDDK